MIQFEDKSKTKKILFANEGINNTNELDSKIPSISLEEFYDIVEETKKSNGEFSTVIIDSFNNIKEI